VIFNYSWFFPFLTFWSILHFPNYSFSFFNLKALILLFFRKKLSQLRSFLRKNFFQEAAIVLWEHAMSDSWQIFQHNLNNLSRCFCGSNGLKPITGKHLFSHSRISNSEQMDSNCWSIFFHLHYLFSLMEPSY
jgi:hypothetical protein